MKFLLSVDASLLVLEAPLSDFSEISFSVCLIDTVQWLCLVFLFYNNGFYRVVKSFNSFYYFLKLFLLFHVIVLLKGLNKVVPPQRYVMVEQH